MSHMAWDRDGVQIWVWLTLTLGLYSPVKWALKIREERAPSDLQKKTKGQGTIE